METRLKKLLEDHAIHADISTWLVTASCCNMDDMATFVEKREQVQTEILDNVPSMKDDRAQKNKLKQVWQIASDEYEAKSDRRKRGWDATEIDDPLDPEDQQDRYDQFSRRHFFSFRICDIGTDPLLGQIVRECEKWTWSFMPMEKIHDLKHQQVTESVKRQKLADDVLLLTNQSYHTTSISHPMQYLQTTNVYLNTMAVGGQKKVKSNLAKDAMGAAMEIVFAPYQDRNQ